MNLIKWQCIVICSFLCLIFLVVSVHTIKTYQKFVIIVFWLVRLLNQKGPGFRTQSSKPCKIFRKNIIHSYIDISVSWLSVITKWFTIQKLNSVMYSTLMYSETEEFISQERNITFPWNKQFLHSVLKTNFQRLSFLAEVTFRNNKNRI